MTFEEVVQILNETGLPNAYYSYPIGQVPNLPYMVFYYPDTNNFGADDKVYAHISALNVELYTKNKDFQTEQAVEAVFESHGLFWNKSESFLDSENMYEVLYEMEIVINGEQD